MNILPKKSWHVRSRQNIERVKRDEAQAAEENRQIQERAALAEQEARTALLRRKAHQLTSVPDDVSRQLTSHPNRDECLTVQTADDQDVSSRHVDLFSELSTEKPKGEKNKEHEKEERAAKEKYERSIGLLTYLGQSSAEAQTTKPWYFKPPDRAATTARESEEQSCTDMKRKASLDPMMEMEKYLGMKRFKGDGARTPVNKAYIKVPSHNSVPVSVRTDHKLITKDPVRKTSPDDKRTKRRIHKSKHKKHKRRREETKSKRAEEKGNDRHRDVSNSERKRRHKEVGDERREEHQEPTIQQLREERLRREAAERAKTSRLLAGEKLDGRGGKESEEKADRPGRYNSQFHPELARNRHKAFHYDGR